MFPKRKYFVDFGIPRFIAFTIVMPIRVCPHKFVCTSKYILDVIYKPEDSSIRHRQVDIQSFNKQIRYI